MEFRDALCIAADQPGTLAIAVLDARAMVIIDDCPCTPAAIRQAVDVVLGGVPGAPIAMATHGPPLGAATEAALWQWLTARCDIADWLVVTPAGVRSVGATFRNPAR